MKVTVDWLKEFIPVPEDVDALVRLLTAAGLPVASVETPAKALHGVVVGKILKIEKHPQADRLTVCRVDVGGETLKIVCGAKNMKEQDLVPVATVGTTLPGGLRIEQATIRGESSFGMMCSKRELGMGEGHEGLFILDSRAAVGRPLAEALGMADTVLDIEVTPNRPDCLSILGIAREIAALTGDKIRTKLLPGSASAANTSLALPVTVQAKDLCWMYCGCFLENVQVGPSPDWLKRRLELVGLRSVNNVVDITNYVLMEQGQPLHAFDAETLRGSAISVRLAREGETLKTIDQVVRSLHPDMLVIADTNRPVALAGVMGGLETEITGTTRRVFLESALFAPASVRKTSRTLGLKSDSSYRFERGVDPARVEPAMVRAIAMLQELAGAQPGPVQKITTKKIAIKKIRVSPLMVEALLGMEAKGARVAKVLKSLGFGVAGDVKKALTVTVPSFRLDVEGPEDLAEEFGRVVGYDRIPVKIPTACLQAPEGAIAEDASIRQILLGHGFDEVLHLSFMSAKRHEQWKSQAGWGAVPVEIANPLDQEQRLLRTTLLDGLLSNVALNQNRGADHAMIFEIGHVFEGLAGGGSRESQRLAFAGAGIVPIIQWEGRKRTFDFFDLKGAVEALLVRLCMTGAVFEPLEGASLFQPGQACRIVHDGKSIGTMGKVAPGIAVLYDLRWNVFLCELDLHPLLHYAGREKLGYQAFSRFPGVLRDIALVLDKSVPAGAVHAFLKEYQTGLLEDVALFDVFDGKGIQEGKRSLAFRLRYRGEDRTLTEAEVQLLHDAIVAALKAKWGCELREA